MSHAAPPKPHDASDMQGVVSRNMFSSVGAKVLYLATRFFQTPIILAYLSLEEYGIWAFAFILIGYLGMSAFGVSNVYIRYVAQYHAQGQEQRIGALLSTGVTLVSVLGLILLAGLWFVLPGLLAGMSVSPDLRDTAFAVIFVTAAIFVVELSWGSFAYVLTGLQQIVRQNQVWVASYLLETALVVAFLVAGLGINGLLWAFVLRYVVSIGLNVWLCFRALPGLKLSLRLFNRADLGLFWRYGGILQIAGLLSMFLRSIEKMIAGFFIDVQATGLFDVGEKFPSMAISVPSSMTAAMLPASAYVHAQERADALTALYLNGSRYVNLTTGFLMGFMAAFAAPLLLAWLGPDPKLALAPLILTLFTLPFQLNVLTGPASNVYRATGVPVRELLLPAVELTAVVLLVGSGFALFGISVTVIAVAVAAAMTISALTYMAWTNRFLHIGQGRFLAQVLLPGLVPYVTGFALLWLFSPWVQAGAADRWVSLALVLVAGAGYCIVQLALLWLWQLAPDERAFLVARLPRRLGRLLVRQPPEVQNGR